MHLRKKITALLFMLVFVLSFGQIKVENSKDLIIGKMQNGMTYYIYKNKMPENRASINVLVKTGSLQEDDDQLGMAHFIEHLCFNGTEKYDKNEVIKYYQSIGLQFGGDLNAHTGFDETVYKLQIPTDDKEKFEKGVEVLKEMTLKPTFKQEAIDSEKDIIVEEWRLSQGLSNRITKVFQEALFDGSRYKERFPIGDMDIIRGTKREVLKRYYDRWYHPENMAVVIVGDFDVKYAENTIKKYFDVKDTRNFTPREEYRVKELNNRYMVFKDKELTYVLLEIVSREDIKNQSEEKKAEEQFKNILFQNLLSNRVNDEINSGKNYIYESGYYNMDLSKDRLITLYSVLNKNNIEEGVRSTLNIIKDMAVNGVSEEELNLEKENIRTMLENKNNNRDSITNEELIGLIRQVFLNKEVFGDTDDILKYYNEFSKNITAEDIKNTAKDFYKDKHVTILFAPDDTGIVIPQEKELENMVIKIKNEPVKKAEARNLNIQLKPMTVTAGKIIEIKEMKNYKKIVLSNGLEFFYKQTDFDKDTIYIKFFKEEGNIKDNNKMYLNSQFASDIISQSGAGNIDYKDLNTFMKGKEFSINPYISDFEQGTVIISNNENFDTALEYFTYLMREPKISENLYNIVITAAKENIENRKNSPDAVYSDEITKIVFNNNLRKRSMTLDDLKEINKEDIMAEFKSKFSSFEGYKGIITGAVTEEKAKAVLEKYFASLPVKAEYKTEKNYLHIKYPENITKKSVTMGEDKKVKVTLYYPVKAEYSLENKYMAQVFEDVLRINLIDEVREKLGGVYGISPALMMSRNENGLLRIRFSTDPKRAEEVTEAVKKEVEKLINGEIKKAPLESVKKNYRLVYENSQKQNSYWINYLSEKFKNGENYEPYSPEKFDSSMNEENLKPFFKKIVDKNNYIQVILIPEREE